VVIKTNGMQSFQTFSKFMPVLLSLTCNITNTLKAGGLIYAYKTQHKLFAYLQKDRPQKIVNSMNVLSYIIKNKNRQSD